MWQDYIKSIILTTVLVCGLTEAYASTEPSNTAAPTQEAPKAEEKITHFEEGKHYRKLPAKVTSSKEVQQFIAEDNGKIQVVEFFSYACFWCQRLHPIMDEWIAKKQDIAVYRFPVVFHPGWDKLAKAYYMVEELGKNKELDKAFFDAIHQNHVNLADEKLLKEFFMSQGVSEEKFKELYNSFAVTRATTRGSELSNAYQIALSPVIILNTPSGSYFITAALVGSEHGVVDVLDYLIAKDTAPEAKPSEVKAAS